MANKKLAALLRSAASALEQGRNATANKKLAAVFEKTSEYSATGPVVTVEGGIVQDVFVLDASAKNGYRSLSYTCIDYDIFESDPAEEIAERWNGLPAELRQYFEKHLPHEFGLFQQAVKEAEAAKTNA